ncbi:hypothetical protein MMC25_005905 [Agyrium rufum]|nr:hypothetical protein [Agyrium rufum]
MVFKPFTHIARHSFAKVAPHGYAQSLVAGAQQSYATSLAPFSNHPSTRFTKPGSAQFQGAFQFSTAAPNSSVKTGTSAAVVAGHDAGLDAYYAAWQKHQNQHTETPEKEWKQFQFAKRIGWVASPAVSFDGKSKDTDNDDIVTSKQPSRAGTVRTASAAVLDGARWAKEEAAEAEAMVKVNNAIAKEIADIQQKALDATAEVQSAKVDGPSNAEEMQAAAVTQSSVSPRSSPAVSRSTPTSPISDVTKATSLPEDDFARTQLEHIVSLRAAGRYAEIPRAFESLIRSNLRPDTQAYNALLQAALRVPGSRYQVTQKALDVYSDLLHRQVRPDSETYTVLLELLAQRSLENHAARTFLEKSKSRYGTINGKDGFLLQSQANEFKMLLDDNSLNTAMKLFELSTASSVQPIFSANTYDMLITACATSGQVDSMIQVYSHMEAQQVKPHATLFAPMIEAFAKSGDLKSSVECYNGYRSLAIADDNGTFAIIQRKDKEVYAAVIKGYTVCGRIEDAQNFLKKITNSFTNVQGEGKLRLQEIRQHVLLNGLLQGTLETGRLQEAYTLTEVPELNAVTRTQALQRICVEAADGENAQLATSILAQLPQSDEASSNSMMAIFALTVRQQNIEQARDMWSSISAGLITHGKSLIEPATRYAMLLVQKGHIDEALLEARRSFTHARNTVEVQANPAELTELIDECIEVISKTMVNNGHFPSPPASLNLMWAMIENGGLLAPVTELVLASIGPEHISMLQGEDLNLILNAEAGIVGSNSLQLDPVHVARFSDLVDHATALRMPLEPTTVRSIDLALKSISYQRPDLMSRWQSFIAAPIPAATPVPRAPMKHANVAFEDDTYDPYAASTDFRGSAIIAEELEKPGSNTSAHLNEALQTLRNIRRAGRHPRAVVYAKLINAAAKESRTNLVHDILGMARNDMPFVPGSRIVRHGWTSILDAMTGACLTSGNRKEAAEYHQELLDMGSAPSANTFGLYITTLKESTKTFDEATEAVKIFHRAQTEGVEATSFLYNALIGKLGKARRIDDCLYYFGEMRTRGIRPTSVTYGTIVNALCRVSDERFAMELFDEMESMPNYKPRPAPYNSIMQFFLVTKRDSKKVLEYYNRMVANNIQPTMHTYKLLIDTHATLSPVDMPAAEAVFKTIRSKGMRPEAVHYASLIHAKGCVAHDMPGARATFDSVISGSEGIRPQACLYQALFESMVAKHQVRDTDSLLAQMAAQGVQTTAYIANTLIHGWAMEKDMSRAKQVWEGLGMEKKEPSTYEAMTRAYLAVEDREGAKAVVGEMLGRGYPSAVAGKIVELLG